MEAIKQAIEEMMTTSPGSDSSPTPSPESTPNVERNFIFDADAMEKIPTKIIKDMSFGGGEDTSVLAAAEGGRSTSTPRKASDVPLNRDELDDPSRPDINALIQASSANQPSISSFQAYPNGPHFTVNPPTTIPTLLTTQSLMSTAQVSQYLNDRPIAYSRPGSSLSTHGLATSSHIGHEGHSHLPLSATHGAQQSVFDSLDARQLLTSSTAPYYNYPPQPAQLPTAPQFVQTGPASMLHHQLQSAYPSAGAPGSNFVQSLPNIPALASQPPAAGGPVLAATGMLPPPAHLQLTGKLEFYQIFMCNS